MRFYKVSLFYLIWSLEYSSHRSTKLDLDIKDALK